MIKKTKREHQLWTQWNEIKNRHPSESMKEMKLEKEFEQLFKRPLSGRWYYTYSNEKGISVGLAKLQDIFYPHLSKRKWMWETCTANDELELRRFPTQKAAEIEIYKFLKEKTVKSIMS